MKKILITVSVLVMLGLSIFHINLNKSPKLPMPAYPLDAVTIETALEKWNPWNTEYIVKDNGEPTVLGRNMYRSTYTVGNANDKDHYLLTGILSGEKEGEYTLNITPALPPARYFLPMEDCKNLLSFSSDLFGNFKNADSLYNKFISDYNRGKNIEIHNQEPPEGAIRISEKVSTWECSVDGVDCRIGIAQPLLDDPKAYIFSIWISTDMEGFYGKKD